MAEIPPEFHDLFEGRAFAQFASVLPDGTPHVVPMWVEYEDGFLYVNTVTGNRKHRNVERDPHVSIAISDPENPYRYLHIRGEVVEMREDVDREHLNKLAERYTGVRKYPRDASNEPGRTILKIRPDAVMGRAPPTRQRR
ncbi:MULTISPECIES: pyridoxamine 5'-phosphate oxidase family protein [unclassified Haladaptatus]|uniref:pyridoxamine 5'-phosphate oxidase family protein n=1 Tax=unclassified Haladaptatus TaxID=2622732 RepID=UPI0023E88E5F|nr:MULTISPECIES: PPOX class F420-dependent oxidoreductase [unclassified Haladaptatus]